MKSVKEIEKGAFESLKSDFGYKNIHQAPKLEKVVISVGTGSKTDKKRATEVITDRLAKITGQKAAGRAAKKSIATYKLREGDTIGYQATLRGPRMHAFLDKLFNIALPRTKDFRGISRGSVDGMGNMTIGIREHTIFPETGDEDIRDIFGMAITLVSSAENKEQALKFFELIGVPFSKE